MSWWVYIIESEDGCLYTGVTTDIGRRFREHIGGRGKRGARYFNGRRPWGVVFLERHGERGSAQRREAAIKRLDRPTKQSLRQSVLTIARN